MYEHVKHYCDRLHRRGEETDTNADFPWCGDSGYHKNVDGRSQRLLRCRVAPIFLPRWIERSIWANEVTEWVAVFLQLILLAHVMRSKPLEDAAKAGPASRARVHC